MPDFDHVIQAYHKSGLPPRLALPGKPSADDSDSDYDYPRRRASNVKDRYRARSSSVRSDAGVGGRRTRETRSNSSTVQATVNRDVGPTSRARDRSPPRQRQRPRSVDPRGKELVRSQERRVRRYSTTSSSSSSSSSDSDSDSDSAHRRRRRGNSRSLTTRAKEKGVTIIPCGDNCADHSARKTSAARSAEEAGDEEHPHVVAEKHRKQNHTRLLYGGLAAASTVATCNGVYQTIKARRARVAQMSTGERCQAEQDKLKMEHNKRDLMALGIAAVGLYNVKVNWRRFENVGK